MTFLMWLIDVALAVGFARHGFAAEAFFFGLIAFVAAVAKAFRMMGYGK